MKTAYYIDRYCDETMPCGTSLDNWAKWLSEPDQEWGRDGPAKDGDTFSAHVYDIHQVSAVQVDGEWVLQPDAPVGTEFMALRIGDGLGWFAEDVCEDIDQLRDALDGEISVHPEAAYFIACGVPKPSVTLTYAGGALTIT